MQIDGESATFFGVASSICSFFLGYGMMQEKISRLREDFKEAKEDQKHFVTHQHLDVVIEPLKETLVGIKKDIREILHQVTSGRLVCPQKEDDGN